MSLRNVAVVAGMIGALVGLGLIDAGATAAPTSSTLSWLVLGDSYSSGEGIPGTTQKESLWGADCARATGWTDETAPSDARAWGVVAYESTEPFTRFTHQDFVACTGHITDDWVRQVREAYAMNGVPTCLQDLAVEDYGSGRTVDAGGCESADELYGLAQAGHRWDLITFSFGGNNLGFGDIALACIGYGFNLLPVPGPLGGCNVSLEEFERRVDLLVGRRPITPANKLSKGTVPVWRDPAQSGGPDALYDSLAHLVSPGGRIIVLGYPQVLEDPTRWADQQSTEDSVLGRSRSCHGIKASDASLVRQFVTYLNDGLREAVSKADEKWTQFGVQFTFADIATTVYETPEGRHGLCTERPWLNGVTIGGITGDVPTSGSFHPRQDGHTATGAFLAGLVESIPEYQRPGGTDPGRPAGADIVEASADAGDEHEGTREEERR
jgi:hypothetical protein